MQAACSGREPYQSERLVKVAQEIRELSIMLKDEARDIHAYFKGPTPEGGDNNTRVNTPTCGLYDDLGNCLCAIRDNINEARRVICDSR